jgi:hypothetical protein
LLFRFLIVGVSPGIRIPTRTGIPSLGSINIAARQSPCGDRILRQYSFSLLSQSRKPAEGSSGTM